MAAFVAGCGGGHGDGPGRASSAPAAPAFTPTTQGLSATNDRGALQSVLRAYGQAYARSDAGAMQVLLSRSISVHRAGAGGCVVASGLPAALPLLVAHTSTPVGDLPAKSLRPERVRFMASGRRAVAVLPTRGQHLTISFGFTRSGTTWKISSIRSHCRRGAATAPTAPSGGPTAPGATITAPSGGSAPTVAHPRPGCTVLLTPQPSPGTSTPSHRPKPAQRPSPSALRKLCRKGRKQK